MEILLALAAAVAYGVSDFAGGVLTRRAHVFVVFLLPGADTLSEHTFGVKYLSRPNRTQVRVGIPSSRWAHCGAVNTVEERLVIVMVTAEAALDQQPW
jgi:hypothetical protein